MIQNKIESCQIRKSGVYIVIWHQTSCRFIWHVIGGIQLDNKSFNRTRGVLWNLQCIKESLKVGKYTSSVNNPFKKFYLLHSSNEAKLSWFATGM